MDKDPSNHTKGLTSSDYTQLTGDTSSGSKAQGWVQRPVAEQGQGLLL